MTRKGWTALVAVIVVIALAVGGYFLQRALTGGQQGDAGRAGGPAVVFDTPAAGVVLAVGSPTPVHAVASSAAKVTRVELWVDGEFETSAAAALADGVSPLPLLAYWEPVTPGPHTLVARAFDAAGGRNEATLAVEVAGPSGADRDGDGVTDTADTCPDEAGYASAGGCPDRDGDMVADAQDACPDEAGTVAGAGCAAPADGDRDGDAVLDEVDACPDTPGGTSGDGCVSRDQDSDGVPDTDDPCPETPGAAGGCPDADGDGVPDAADPCLDVPGEAGGCPGPSEGDGDGDGLPDAEDACPGEPGAAENSGCPGGGPAGAEDDADADGDGVADVDDSCPGAPGSADLEGCPDADGDGVPDYRDMCPAEAGPALHLGCPAGGADTDGDGLADDVDMCPEDEGMPERLGCPPPGEERELVPAGEMFLPATLRVEFEAVSLDVGDDYDGVFCYPSLAGGPAERYAFTAADGRSWESPADLTSRVLLIPEGESLAVRMECGADVTYLDEDHAWGTYWGIGAVENSHPASDWDGHVITARSTGGDEGRWFEVQYRLCLGGCVEPTSKAVTLARDGARLTWEWDDETQEIAGYAVYLDGVRIALYRGTSSTGTADVSAWAPPCGGTREFTVTAVFPDGSESEPSNAVAWVGEDCPRVVRVTFDHINTFNLGSDQGSDRVGPIYGSFTATGSTSRTLSFNALDRGDWWGEVDRGFRLRSTHSYPVQAIFDQVNTWVSGINNATVYSAPEHDWVTVELAPGDDLTVGGFIGDGDRGTNPDDTLFAGSRTVAADDIRPGTYRVSDRNIELTVLVEVIVGPEVGPEPDLTLTGVWRGADNELNVQVFNNAASMAEPTDLTVEWMDIATGSVVDSQTWRDVQLGSGATRTLQTTDPVAGIGGMHFVLDSGGPDGNPANDTLDTPVTMRVEFLEVSEANCSEISCSIFHCHRNWTYAFWAGFGPARDTITWDAFHVPFPSSGDLYACTHEVCDQLANPAEDWIAEGDPSYTFDFEVPATENVYVMATAAELDVTTDDDPFATLLSEYLPAAEWGARATPWESDLLATRPCDDGSLCNECYEGVGGTVGWRITRVD